MTIAVSVKVHDGIVFASDSAGTIGANGAEINVYNNLNKIFNLHKKAPIAGMMCGSANIGRSSIATLIKDLRRRLTDGYEEGKENWKLDPNSFTLELVNARLRRFINESLDKVTPQDRASFTMKFFVGGYSVPGELSQLWRIEWVNGESIAPTCARTCEDTGADWDGMPESLERLVFGFDPQLKSVLEGFQIPEEQVIDFLRGLKRKFSTNFESPAMPIQDAIDLAEFYAHTAINYTKFHPGTTKSIGGPIEIAAVTKHEGFTWIRRKHYFKMEYNAGKDLQ